MIQMSTYIMFNGNCRDAMEFYQQCFGGKLHFKTVGESPLCEDMPSEMRRLIMHAVLATKNWRILGSDLGLETKRVVGNALSLNLEFTSPLRLKSCFERLTGGCCSNEGPVRTFSGGLSASFTDQFGTNWLLSFETG